MKTICDYFYSIKYLDNVLCYYADKNILIDEK